MIALFDDHNEEIYQMIKDLDFRETKEYSSLDEFGIGIDPATVDNMNFCLLYTSPSPRDQRGSRMPSSA